ncbi:hypothetical protein FOA43_002364 [Brettanomyces nanus]|uniref:Uncharacterized protein n=1 Tax=Eeniella nana TaxID=13502 RepID=A0A875S769_EENNA|nr:uncharacterized protein FOA43_002364 [Brettanomyces nanus]QPG75024.1 hypothetical protein FOA43_002364 [Brettanomyces nanus]
MSRLLNALRALGVDEEDTEAAYNDDFLFGLQGGDNGSESCDSDEERDTDMTALLSFEDSDKMGLFREIVRPLPYELKVKIFRMSLGKFYETELLSYLHNDCILPVLKVFYDELLIGDGKLYFGGFNEYDVIKFGAEEFQSNFKQVVAQGRIRIKILKIFDLDDVLDEDIKLLLSHAEKIWCASVVALAKIYDLCPDAVYKITDLSVENLDQLTRQKDLRPIFQRLAKSLKDFTLPLGPDDFDRVEAIFDTLKDVDHNLTIHLPISYPIDGNGELDFLHNLLDPYYSKIKLAHILFTLVSPNFHMNDLKQFLQKVGYQKFTDFCLVSFPNFRVQGDLKFLSQLTNLVTIVLSGSFALNCKNFGSLTKLTHLKEFMLESCKLDSEWFNNNLPRNLKDLTISYNSFTGIGTYKVPSCLKVLTILCNDSFNLKLDNLDFSESNLSVLKFRIDDESQWNKLTVSFANLPANLQEINCYKLTSFIVEKDIKLSKKKNLVVYITTYSESMLPKNLRLESLKANVKVKFRCFKNYQFSSLGAIEKIDSIGGLPNRLLDC